MKAYSIFDDFNREAIEILETSGVDLTIHPRGVPRPDEDQMKKILEKYDCVIIGTSQKIRSYMFENIEMPKIIATASVGLDHIVVPEEKKKFITIYNTPKANAQSVAEFTIGTALGCTKRLSEGADLYLEGKSNKSLEKKPEDICGKVIGVIGAGNISMKIMEYATLLGMRVIFWTAHPEKHILPYEYVPLDNLVKQSDIISVNLPNNNGTKGLISADLVQKMKDNCIFISVSRLATIDIEALVEKAQANIGFYVNVDIDVDDEVVKLIQNKKHVYITPHIGGGTIETRKRMFTEIAEQIARYASTQKNK